MNARKASQWLVVLGSSAVLLFAVGLLVRRLPSGVARLRDQAEMIRQLTTPAESIPASAIDQRYRLRRAVVQSMRTDLIKLVAVEAAFVADSGYPTTNLQPPYVVSRSPGNLLRNIRLLPDGWSAEITNDNVPIICSVTVTFDSSLARPVAGQPVCVGAQQP